MLRLVVAGTFVFRRFDEVEAYSDRLIALDPSDYMGYINKALARVNAHGDTAGAVRTLSKRVNRWSANFRCHWLGDTRRLDRWVAAVAAAITT